MSQTSNTKLGFKQTFCLCAYFYRLSLYCYRFYHEVFHSKMSTVLSNIKVARVVNLKLVFMDYFLQFGSTNQVMQNPTPKLRLTSIISKKLGFLSGKLKTLTRSNYPTVQYFLLKFCTCFLLRNISKSVWGIFFAQSRYQKSLSNIHHLL